MSDQKHLDWFRNEDGSTSHQGQRNAGERERVNNYTPAPQQPWESREAYLTRINH